MSGKGRKKKGITVSSAKSIRSSIDNEEQQYNVERIIDKRICDGKVSVTFGTLVEMLLKRN